MKLTQEEVDVLIKVRENMQRRYEEGTDKSAPYICWNILEAIRGRCTMFDGATLQEQVRHHDISERLYRHLTWALSGAGTMDQFICRETWQFGPVFAVHARKYAAEARLAWLDRMIEMKDIK